MNPILPSFADPRQGRCLFIPSAAVFQPLLPGPVLSIAGRTVQCPGISLLGGPSSNHHTLSIIHTLTQTMFNRHRDFHITQQNQLDFSVMHNSLVTTPFSSPSSMRRTTSIHQFTHCRVQELDHLTKGPSAFPATGYRRTLREPPRTLKSLDSRASSRYYGSNEPMHNAGIHASSFRVLKRKQTTMVTRLPLPQPLGP